MKFTCHKDNLAKNLSVVSKAIPLKHSLPVLTNVLMVSKDGRIRLTGSDMDTTISVYLGASVDEEGAITIPAKQLSEFLGHLSTDTLAVDLDDDVLHIDSGSTQSKFVGVDANDFPELQEPAEDLHYLEINPKDFYVGVFQVGFSVAIDDTRPVFSGILMNYEDNVLTFVASDGFRLSEKSMKMSSDADDFSMILPSKTMMEIARIFSSCDENIKIMMDVDNNLCFFLCEDITVVSRVIDGTYPDYKKIIPTQNTLKAIFSSEELFEAVKLTHVFTKGSGSALKMIVSEDGIQVLSSLQETGENTTELSAEVEGDPLEIVFNARFLLEFFSNNKHDKLLFIANDTKSPCIIKPLDDDTYVYVMAPMQLND